MKTNFFTRPGHDGIFERTPHFLRAAAFCVFIVTFAMPMLLFCTLWAQFNHLFRPAHDSWL